jgi:VCBS repeat-containing protein
LTYRVRSGPGLDPFVTLGAGVLTTSGAPAITVVGDYQFQAPVSGSGSVLFAAMQQTDTVTIHMSDGRSRPVAIVGVGIEGSLSAQRGFRFAAELAIGSNQAETTIDANPTTTLSAPAVDEFIFSPTATLIFNNKPQGSTLGGPVLTNFKTFVGTGIRIESSLTASYFFRF